MNIRLDQLKSHLANKTLAPIYLVTGDELVLVRDACELIAQTAHQQGFTEHTIMSVDQSFSWQTLSLNLHQHSLFSDKQFFDVRLTENKLTESAITVITQYCQAKPANTLLLLKMAKIDSAGQKTKWFQLIAQHGIIVTVSALTHPQLPLWIQQRAHTLGMSMTPAVAKLFADYIEGNLIAADQELQKLHLIYGNRSIGQEEILATLTTNYHYDLFALVDYALQKDSQRVLRIFQNLKDAATEPVLILWALTRELRTLSQLAYRLRHGDSFATLCQTHRIWPQRKAMVQQALQQRTEDFFHHLLQQARLIDELIKTTQTTIVWDKLLALVLTLAGINLCTNNL